MAPLSLDKLKKKTIENRTDRQKKKTDRFDGLSEEEIQKYTLPDYLEMNLDIVFIGINPSLMAAYRGRYYVGSSNHFYELLYKSGLTPRLLTYEEDYKLPMYGIGLTNVVQRPTRSSADLKQSEIKEYGKIIEQKLMFYKPKIAVFNGKCIFNKTNNFNFGLQAELIGESAVWVTPSSSARCANFPRLIDKLKYFISLKKYLQFLKGEIECVDMKDFIFEGKCKNFIPHTSKMWRRKGPSAFLHGGKVANKETMSLSDVDGNIAYAYSTEFVVKKLQGNENCNIDQRVQANECKLSWSSESGSDNDTERVFENVYRQKEHDK